MISPRLAQAPLATVRGDQQFLAVSRARDLTTSSQWLVAIGMSVPPLEIPFLLTAVQRPELPILAALLGQVSPVGAILAAIPAMIVLARLIVDAKARGATGRSRK
jgi:hypothetical protein